MYVAYAEKNGEFNVISVDWSLISNKKNYVAVAKTCNEVGAIVAQLLMNLEDLSLVVPAMLHVIGHSLGAHVAGAVGQVHVRMKKSKIARISGQYLHVPQTLEPYLREIDVEIILNEQYVF